MKSDPTLHIKSEQKSLFFSEIYQIPIMVIIYDDFQKYWFHHIFPNILSHTWCMYGVILHAWHIMPCM